jgi:hypothetical protein
MVLIATPSITYCKRMNHVESSVENEQNLYSTVLYIRCEVDDCLRGEQIVMRQRE